MKNRRYIIDNTPKLTTWFELIDYYECPNCENVRSDDVEPLTETEIIRLTRLERDDTLPLGHCEVRRVI